MMFYYSWQLSIIWLFSADCVDCDSRCLKAVPQHQ